MSLNPAHKFLDEAAEQANTEQAIQAIETQIWTLQPEEREGFDLHLRKEIANGEGPKNAKELHECIYALYQIALPTAAVSGFEHNVSPFEAVYRVYFGHWEKSLWWANREGGKTLDMTLLHDLLGRFNPKHHGLHAGGVMRQAKVASEALTKFQEDPALSTAYKKAGALSASFKNGSEFKISPGKYKSVDGQHPNTFSADEVKHWDIKSLNQTWKLASARHGYSKRTLFGSTNQDAGGGFNFILDEAPKRNVHIAKWSCLETMQACKTCEAIDEVPFPATGDAGDNQRECVCNLWRYCRGVRALKSTGWNTVQQVREDIISLGGPMHADNRTQMFCLEPSTKGLCIHNFVHLPHKLGGNYTNLTYDTTGELPFYASLDPSEANVASFSFWHVYEGEGVNISIMVDELVLDDCPDDSTAKVALYNYLREKGYRDPKVVVIDPRRTNCIATFRSGTEGSDDPLRHFFNAVAPPIDDHSGGPLVDEGIKEYRMEVCDGSERRLLWINPDRCPRHIFAIKNWFYPTDPSTGEIKGTAKPKEFCKDENDDIRYWVRYKRIKIDKKSGGIGMLGG